MVSSRGWTAVSCPVQSAVARFRTSVVRAVIFLLLVAAGVVLMNIPRLVRGRRLAGPALNPFAPLVDSGIVPADTLPLDSARIIAALAGVPDPELDLSIVELGLVHDIRVDSSGNIGVTLSLTTPECPFIRHLGSSALAAIKKVPGARRIEVKLDPAIPWDPSRLGPEARARYRRLFGDDTATGR